MINIIVAYSRGNRVIGRGNEIPWRLPEDLKHFKQTTTNSVLIMGRNTWNSLPEQYRPLPGRINIVLSRIPFRSMPEDKCYICSSLEFAIDLTDIAFPHKEIYIIGGQQVYEYALGKQLVDRIIATEIEDVYDGDKYFPELIGNWDQKMLKKLEEFEIVEYSRL